MTRSRIFKYLASWWTTSGILSCVAASYLVCLFGAAPYTDWTTFILHKPLGLLLYSSLAANILFASLRIIISGTGRPQITPETVQTMDIRAALPADKLKELAGLMKQKGFTVIETEATVHAIKHRYSFVPGTLVRAGLVIFLVSVLASAHMRRSSETIVHEGETLQAFGRQVLLKAVFTDLPEEFLQVGEEGTFRLGAVKAELQALGSTRTISTGFPVRIDGLYYRITHFGLMQPAVFRGTGLDKTLQLDLDILPPGRTGLLPLSQELFLAVALQPEKTISKGLLKGKEYNLKKPYYHIVLQKGSEKEKFGELNIREDETAASSGVSVSLGRHAFYLKVQAVSDPSIPFIYAGSLLILIGILLMFSRFFWYKKELSAVCKGELLHIGYKEEFFKKWASQKFHRWLREYIRKDNEIS